MGKRCCHGKKGKEGPTGPQGLPGQSIVGPTGPTGPIGIAGENGATGPFGATTFTWSLINTAILINSDTLFKLPTFTDWDSGAYSLEGYINGVFTSFQPNSTDHYFVAGFTEDNTQPIRRDGDQVAYGWFLDQFANAYIVESGNFIYGPGPYTSSDIFQITYDGNNITYLQNGAIIHTTPRSIGNTLYLAVALGDDYVQVNNVHFGPQGQSAPLPGSIISGSIITNTEEFVEATGDFTLPPISNYPPGQKLTLVNSSSSTISIQPSSGDNINYNPFAYSLAGRSTTFYINPGGNSWIAT